MTTQLDYTDSHEQTTWLGNEVVRLQRELRNARAVIDAARGVLNCIADDSRTSDWHEGGGSCLDMLRRSVDALDQDTKV